MRNKIKKEDISFVIFCICTGLIFALYRTLAGDFVSYNGDFQNYNIFRRILDGQTQYSEFTNYLGNGFVIVNIIFLYFFRNFGDSVFITNFTTSIMYSLILYISIYLVTKNKITSYKITSVLAVLAFVIYHAGYNSAFYYNYIYNFVFFEQLGHSMRTTRGVLPFLIVGIYLLFFRKNNKKLVEIISKGKVINLIIYFFILGILTVWSNDFGYACVGCFFIITVLVSIFYSNRNVINRLGLYCVSIISILIGAGVSIAIITKGDILSYIETTIEISSYQFWYYGNVYGKYFTLFDIFSDKKFLGMTILFLIHAFYFLEKTIKKEICDDSIHKLFLHSSCYAASLIYVIGSGSHNYAALEVITDIFLFHCIYKFLFVIIEYIKRLDITKKLIIILDKLGLRFLVNKSGMTIKENMFTIYVLIMLILYVLSVNVLRNDIIYSSDREKIKGLNVTSVIGEGLDEFSAKVKESTVFSTYASAIETINGTFQPSGIDYIIHVLGDKKREAYLDNFITGDYLYATTLKNEYTVWEYWASRANWFFYRELYRHYQPYDETNYSILWIKSDDDNEIDTKVNLKYDYLNESTCKIEIELPEYKGGAYVDLEIAYNTEWTSSRLLNAGLRKAVCVQDGGEQYNAYNSNTCYYIKEQADSYYIPVYVRNGKGYAYISSYPLSCTTLNNVNVKIRGVIKEPEFNLHVTNYTDISRFISKSGVNEDGTLLQFDNTEYNTTKLMNAAQVISNGEKGEVSNVWKDGNYIYVKLKKPVDRKNFIYPNTISIIPTENNYTALNLTDMEWVAGISREQGILVIDKNIDINVNNLIAVKADDIWRYVSKVKTTEEGIEIYFDDNIGIQKYAYPQELEFIFAE